MSAPRARREPAPVPLTDDDVPRAPEAERAILGAVQLDPRGVERASAIVAPADFHGPANVAIWAAVLRLRNRGSAVDPVTLAHELQQTGELANVGGPAYVAGLLDGVPHSANVEHYARIVKDKAVRRGIMSRAHELVRACTNGHETHELTEAGAALFRDALAADPQARGRVISTADALAEYATDAAKVPGRKVWTGLKPIDDATDGIGGGEVVTVVKRPQVGGSALASQFLVNASIAGVPSVFFSLEMPRPQAVERLMQQRLGLTRHEVEQHAKAGWRTLTDAQREMRDALARTVVVVDRGKSGIADLDASMTEATAILGRPPRLAAVDYLQLMSSGARNLPIYQRTSEAALDLKSFAKRHNLALIVISQAGRDQDRKRTEGAAELGIDAARDSGMIEEACDWMLTAWRPELDSALTPDGRAEVRGDLWGAVVKNRRGPLSRFRLHLDAATLRIREWGAGE